MSCDDQSPAMFYQNMNNSRNVAGVNGGVDGDGSANIQQQNTSNNPNSHILTASNTMSELSRMTFLDNSISLSNAQFSDAFFNPKIDE